MVRRLGRLFAGMSRRFMPHPFVFALLLTLLTFGLGLVWTRTGPRPLLAAWYGGFAEPSNLAFALQMALVLVTGHALAETAPARRLLAALAGTARGTRSAAAVTALAAMIAALLNWGLGLIVGAILARDMARSARSRGLHLHYPLVVAAGYTGLLIWHGGLSGSAPLSVATPGHPLAGSMGVIPIRATLFSPLNLAVTAFLLIAVPFLLAAMAPRPGDPLEEAEPGTAPPAREPSGERTPARRLEESRLLVWAITLGALGFLVPAFLPGGRGVNLNTVILAFLALGLVLHGTPRSYAASVDRAVGGAGGILLQFPFYFGVMGMMRDSGLVARFADLAVHGATALAAAGIAAGPAQSILTFLSAAVVNLFVPSGGGQWAVQGPVVIEAAARLGNHLPPTVMALAYGDELTNMLQPFWALPLLAVTGLEARQIVGYTALLMLLVTPGFLILLALLGA